MYTGSERLPDRNDRPSEDNGRPTTSGDRTSNIVDDALLGDAREPCCEQDRTRADSLSEMCCEESMPMAAAPSGNVRDIAIVKLNYGYVVTVGCHKFAIETPETVIAKLGEYLKDPLGTEMKWFEGKLFL